MQYTVVTGAASGMGRAIAAVLAASGVPLVLIDRDARVIELSGAGSSAPVLAEVTDIADAQAVTAIIDEVNARHGPTLGLVNNAAMMIPAPLEDTSLADWKRLIDVNLTGAFILSQAVGRHMRAAGRGSIVHVGSVAATLARNGGGAYSAAKAGLVGLSSTICVEWGRFGIRSNVVHPGLMRTPLSEDYYRDARVNEQRCAQIALGRPGSADDVAQVVQFLLSDASGYVSGAELTVDGGFSRMGLKNYPVPPS